MTLRKTFGSKVAEDFELLRNITVAKDLNSIRLPENISVDYEEHSFVTVMLMMLHFKERCPRHKSAENDEDSRSR